MKREVMKRRHLTLRLLIIAALILPALAGIDLGGFLESGARADSRSAKKPPRIKPDRKLSKDLKDATRGNPEKRVQVIIQTESAPQLGLLSSVTRTGNV
ncbi:MAG TPA: hypothetical protein VNO14_10230, partial [Blastocatellia bacterium]|nr:hypothetical protein [Blastocatellia bacterium]